MNSVCDCGRKRGPMNSTNWSRHKKSCKSKRIKLSYSASQNNCTNITKFFNPTNSRNSVETKCAAVSDQDNSKTLDVQKDTTKITLDVMTNEEKINGQENVTTVVSNENPDKYLAEIPFPTVNEENLAENQLLKFGNDPAVFSHVKKLSPELIDHFFKTGAAQPTANELENRCFPIDSHGRSFHENWYWKTIASGEVVRRKWLSYSLTKNKLYCLFCALFGNNYKTNWVNEGICNWKNGILKIVIHETSEAHVMASIKAMHCLPFRGHREGWNEKLTGNFKDLALLLAKYSPALSAYIIEVKLKGRKMNNFLSWQRQNQFIQAISTNIKNTIQKEILNARFFSISLDTTFDVSKKEQVSVVFRYINKDSENCIVNERLVAVRETVMTTGQQLFLLIEEICKEMNIEWKTHLIGQSYDGAASMRGVYNGLQAIIKQQNPSATYVWCWAHRLSLVIVDAVSSCTEARDLFGNLETLYDFIGSSKKRTSLYSEYQTKRYPGKPLRRLERVDTTRWSSHSTALQTIFYTYDSILDTLNYLQDDITSDRMCCVKAKSLYEYMLSERFVLTGLTFKNFFDIISPLSLFLQGKNIDLLAAVSYVKCVEKKILSLRSENEFHVLLKEKEEFITSKNDEFYITPLIQTRMRRKKVMAGDMTLDEQQSQNPIQNFKINTYFIIIDIVNTQLSERFNECSIPLIKDLALFQKKRLVEITKSANIPADAFNGFEQVYGKFVTAENLRKEYIQFASVYLKLENSVTLPKKLHKQKEDIIDVLHSDTENSQNSDDDDFNSETEGTIHTIYNVCCKTGLNDIFPSLYIALSIALTLPISSASPERAFSKLKLIKTRLRSTMCENRLEGLMIMSCEKDISVDPNDIIQQIASYSSVLTKLLT
ncbi:zinc finger MYM-type protein 1-like [Rhopalosiphum padi]|uniref:zinc finger MYM-type protein 1-like n=1 Tax=Rhopalosiphum padi TaxID=40932 RepID=UPI00298D8631|nr:zinc finger MYM-type protein 1-like [Rhopalosiphum padi]